MNSNKTDAEQECNGWNGRKLRALAFTGGACSSDDFQDDDDDDDDDDDEDDG